MGFKSIIIELLSTITLLNFNLPVKHNFNKFLKSAKMCENLIFVFCGIDPSKTSAVINKNNIIMKIQIRKKRRLSRIKVN